MQKAGNSGTQAGLKTEDPGLKTVQRVGVLAFQGDVIEHKRALAEAGKKLGIELGVVEVRKKNELASLDGLVIPGGESTTISKLIWMEGMEDGIGKIRKIFGTCAGAILLAKKVNGAEDGQKFLSLMNIEVSRNAYGPQTESFEREIETKLGKVKGVFIRAPIIGGIGAGVKVLAEFEGKPIAVEQKAGEHVYIALTFHPELAGETKFHEHFLKI